MSPRTWLVIVIVASIGCYRSHELSDDGSVDGGVPVTDGFVPPDRFVRPDAGPDPEEEPPPPDAQVTQLAVGRSHACALTDAGEVYCWGSNEVGESAAGSRRRQLRPSRVRGLGSVAQIATANTHTCALGVGGELWCWGFSYYGQLGVPEAAIPSCGSAECSRVALRVPRAPMARVFMGHHGTCARATTGAIECWGRDTTTRATPTDELFGWEKLDFGLMHGCALEGRGGAVRCFGTDGEGSAFGRLGDEGRGDGVVRLVDVVDVEVGTDHACALEGDGDVLCWGYDWAGALGVPKAEIPDCRFSDIGGRCIEEPRRPTGLPLATALSAGGSRSCVIDDEARVWCWGSWTDASGSTSSCGPLTDLAECEAFAEPVEGLEDVVAVDTGYSLTCALDGSGAVWCWGFGDNGLGDGEVHPGLVPSPVRVAGFGD